MDNNENQVLEIETSSEEEDLFEGLEVAEEEGTPTETEVTEEPSEKVEEKSTEPFLRIKYNKEEKGLTQEEATLLAQKGMNYDNIYGKYNQLNSQLEKLAKMNGMDLSSYLQTLDDTQMQLETSKEMKSLKEKYPNSDESLLMEIAKQRVSNRLSENEKVALEKQQQEEDTDKKEIARQVEIFNRHYPNLEADKLDPKVYEYMKDGYTLLEAYSLYKDVKLEEKGKQAEKSAQIKAQNDANKQRSLGNISTSANNTADDFLNGFLNG